MKNFAYILIFTLACFAHSVCAQGPRGIKWANNIMYETPNTVATFDGLGHPVIVPYSTIAPVQSVFSRTGSITAASGDYSAFYPLLSGSYANPPWITSLPWSKITSTPTTLSGYSISDGVSTSGSYANPPWITSLPWSKITSTPTTLSGYSISDGVINSRTITINGVTQDLSANRTFTVGTSSLTNSGAANEMVKSNGTNLIGTKIFSASNGSFTFGDGTLAGTARQFVADGSGTNVGFQWDAKGDGVFKYNAGTAWFDLTGGSATGLFQVDGKNFNITLNSPTNPNTILTNTPASSVPFQISTQDANNTSVIRGLSVAHQVTNTASAGIGTSLSFATENSGGSNSDGSTIKSISTNIGLGTEAFDLSFETMTGGTSIEKFRILSDGTYGLGGNSTGGTSRDFRAYGSGTNVGIGFYTKGTLGNFYVNTPAAVVFDVGTGQFSMNEAGSHYSTTGVLENIIGAASTNTVLQSLVAKRSSTNTPAAGIGTAIAFSTETNASSNFEDGVILESVSTDVSGSSEDFDFVIKTQQNGAIADEKVRVTSTGAIVAPLLPTANPGTTGSIWNDEGNLRQGINYETVSTINATPATLKAVSVATSNTTITFEGTIIAARNGGISGSAGDGAGYKIYACYHNISGTVSAIGTPIVTVIGESQAGWDVTFTVSGTDVQIKVTGAASNSIAWRLHNFKSMTMSN